MIASGKYWRGVECPCPTVALVPWCMPNGELAMEVVLTVAAVLALGLIGWLRERFFGSGDGDGDASGGDAESGDGGGDGE